MAIPANLVFLTGEQQLTTITGYEFIPVDNGGSVVTEVASQVLGQGISSPVIQTNATAVSATLTAANVLNGNGTACADVILFLTGAITAATNVTLPTVASLLAAINLPQIGTTYRLRVVNVAGTGSGVFTVVTNTGWTLNAAGGAATVAVGGWREFIVKVTSVSSATATLQTVGTGTFS
jgi:hypothetical protein